MFSSNTSQVSSAANFVEDVFSTYLYTGTGSSQTITNNIDTTTYGGLVWIKGRGGSLGHRFTDTARGTTKSLASNSDAAQATESTGLTAFGTTGFTIGADADYNTNSTNYVSWTFRKQAKFFDVVTYTGDGTGNRALNHSLASTPGCIIIKRTNDVSDWPVYHIGAGTGTFNALALNQTSGTGGILNPVVATSSTTFTVRGSGSNESGINYVAYLFAHNAGGFGTSGTDNVISCGSYTGTGSAGLNVTLGYEPQWVLIKNASTSGDDWMLEDIMRGMDNTGSRYLNPNAVYNEGNAGQATVVPTATGFRIDADSGWTAFNTNGNTYIYIAIRRGPMKTPTSGTSVYTGVARTGTGSATNVTGAGFPPDLAFIKNRSIQDWIWADRLRGGQPYLISNGSSPEQTDTGIFGSDTFSSTMDGIKVITSSAVNASSNSYINYLMRRAPGFFDEVCYTGDGTSGATQSHNLGVVPEMMIVKKRDGVASWTVYHKDIGNTKAIFLNSATTPTTNSAYWNDTTPTSSIFTLGSAPNGNGSTYVNYLFASCAGVSKVSSYTGTGSTQTISCGFAARFVMIKRTDSTGSWWIWDTARGMVSGTDPRLATNSDAAETNANWVYTDASGFQIVTTDATVNASGGSYLYLAIS
jgi:hypothetical protein